MLILRVIDMVLAVIWLWLLVISLRWGRIGGRKGHQSSRSERPLLYWLIIALMGLMILHFGGLAVAGM